MSNWENEEQEEGAEAEAEAESESEAEAEGEGEVEQAPARLYDQQEIPDELLAARRHAIHQNGGAEDHIYDDGHHDTWYYHCREFAYAVAVAAGAPDLSESRHPDVAYASTRSRTQCGADVHTGLTDGVASRELKPGMLVFCKANPHSEPYEEIHHLHNGDVTGKDTQHWFVYLGLDSDGEPRFTDSLHERRTIHDQFHFLGTPNTKFTKWWGPALISAFYDPFDPSLLSG